MVLSTTGFTYLSWRGYAALADAMIAALASARGCTVADAKQDLDRAAEELRSSLQRGITAEARYAAKRLRKLNADLRSVDAPLITASEAGFGDKP